MTSLSPGPARFRRRAVLQGSVASTALTLPRAHATARPEARQTPTPPPPPGVPATPLTLIVNATRTSLTVDNHPARPATRTPRTHRRQKRLRSRPVRDRPRIAMQHEIQIHASQGAIEVVDGIGPSDHGTDRLHRERIPSSTVRIHRIQVSTTSHIRRGNVTCETLCRKHSRL